MNKKIFFFVHLFYFQFLFIFPFLVEAESYKREKCENVFNEEALDFMSYTQLQDLVKELNIKTKKDFFQFALSENLKRFPINPNKFYEEWSSWEDFLGVENAGEFKKSSENNKINILLEEDNLDSDKKLTLKEGNLDIDKKLTESNLSSLNSKQEAVDASQPSKQKRKISNV